MKNTFHIIGLLLLLSGCYSDPGELQNVWIETYSEHSQGTDNHTFRMEKGNILKFQNDTLTTKEFIYEYPYSMLDVRVSKYQTSRGRILTKFFGQPSILKYKINKNGLTLSYDDLYPTKTYYKKLPKYHLAAKKTDFQEFLSSSTFEIPDGTRIEFTEDGQLLNQRLLKKNSYAKSKWRIDNFDGELFIAVNGHVGVRSYVIHVSEFDGEKFVGKVYQKETKETVYVKVSN